MKSFAARGMIVLVFLGFFAFSGCLSKPQSYEFAEGSPNASITFKTGNPSVRFVSFNGRPLPDAEKNTYWDPIVFPAGTAIQMTVRANYEQQTRASGSGILGTVASAATAVSAITRAVDTNVNFTCPALTAGAKYQLSFDKGAGIPGKNTLILTDLGTRKVVFEQEF